MVKAAVVGINASDMGKEAVPFIATHFTQLWLLKITGLVLLFPVKMDALWWTYKKQLKMAGPVEIVDFPINSMVDLSMAKCDSSPGRVDW